MNLLFFCSLCYHGSEGGFLVVSPHTGIALSTNYVMSTSGWSDDPSDFPLAYDFCYSVATSNLIPPLVIRSLGPVTSVTTQLPAGLDSRGNNLILIARALDVYLAAANTTTSVNVHINASFSATAFFQAQKKAALASGSFDAVLSLVSLVSSSISVTNCSRAPHCATLFRDTCLNTPQTCSRCLPSYIGIVGDANTKCHKVNVTKTSHGQRLTMVGSIGDKCSNGDDCLYNLCRSGSCMAPNQTCPSGDPSSICSGHGSCKFFDTSGNPFPGSCSILNTFCTGKCVCAAGFGGAECSLDPKTLAARSAARVGMCASLLTTSSKQDKSAQLFDSIATALLSSFEFSEITTIRGQLACSALLKFLGKMASQGYLKGTKLTTQQFYAEISSQFITASASGGVPPSSQLYEMALTGNVAYYASSTASATALTLASNVDHAVNGLMGGVQKTMVAGQTPTSIVSENVCATMANQLASSFSDALFQPPQTDAGIAGNVPLPTIRIVGNTLLQCGFTGGYAQIGTSQLSTNPYPGSSAVQSPLLKFSADSTTTTTNTKARRRRRLEQKQQDAEVNEQQDRELKGWPTGQKTEDYKPGQLVSSASASSAMLPAFYVIMPFSTPQMLNFTAMRMHSKQVNYSLPACSMRQGNVYVSCGNCNITSVTTWNVTYGCYDIDKICPQRAAIKTKKVRYLRGASKRGSSSTDDATAGLSLNATDDATDDRSATDDRFSTKVTVGGNTFGALADAVTAEVTATLSFNPLTMDLSKAMPVFALVGSFVFVMLTGFAFFLRWDKYDRHEAMYLREYKVEEERKKIEEDLRKGGCGVVEEGDDSEVIEIDSEKKGEEAEKVKVKTFIGHVNNAFDFLKYGKRAHMSKIHIDNGSAGEGLGEASQLDQAVQDPLRFGPRNETLHTSKKSQYSMMGKSQHGDGSSVLLTHVTALIPSIILHAPITTSQKTTSSTAGNLTSRGGDEHDSIGSFIGRVGTSRKHFISASSDLSSSGEHSMGHMERVMKNMGWVNTPVIIDVEEAKLNDADDEKKRSYTKHFGELAVPVLVADFSNAILSGLASKKAEVIANEKEKDGSRKSVMLVQEVLGDVLNEHYFFNAWLKPSLRKSRTIRWLSCCKECLVALFMDTLIFGISFPTDGSCEAYTTYKTCTATPSKVIAGGTECMWTKATKSCSTTPPPGGIIFLMVISMLTTILATPLIFGVEYFQYYAAMRPDLQMLLGKGFNMNSWFGAVHFKSDEDKSALALAMREAVNQRRLEGNGTSESYTDIEMNVDMTAMSPMEIDEISTGVYHQFSSPAEELMRLLEDVQESIQTRYKLASIPPWKATHNTKTSREAIASLRAVEEQLMINPDGTLKPLTVRQRLFYGDRETLLLRQLTAAQKESFRIRDELEKMEVPDESLKDIALIRSFILEQIR